MSAPVSLLDVAVDGGDIDLGIRAGARIVRGGPDRRAVRGPRRARGWNERLLEAMDRDTAVIGYWIEVRFPA